METYKVSYKFTASEKNEVLKGALGTHIIKALSWYELIGEVLRRSAIMCENGGKFELLSIEKIAEVEK